MVGTTQHEVPVERNPGRGSLVMDFALGFYGSIDHDFDNSKLYHSIFQVIIILTIGYCFLHQKLSSVHAKKKEPVGVFSDWFFAFIII